MQFNEASSSFELFSLKVPIERDQNGLAIRPLKNPTNCAHCHGSDPHPIWGRYSSWPGIYGAKDDYLKGEELGAFRNFMRQKDNVDRYSTLIPMFGSSLSPYSPEARGNFQFRPNNRLSILLNHLNARRLASRVRSSPSYERFGRLLALSLACGPEYPGTPWTDQEREKISQLLEPLLKAANSGKIPYPRKAFYHIDNLIYLFGTDAFDWNPGLFFTLQEFDVDDLSKVISYFDGTTFNDSLVSGPVLSDVVRTYPEILPYYFTYSMWEYLKDDYRLVRTPFDEEFLKTSDAMIVSGHITDNTPNPPGGCKRLYRIVSDELLGRGD